MGSIVFWGIIRAAILIPVLWVAFDYIDYGFWWTIIAMSIYGVIIHPALIQYRFFREANDEIINNTLCSSCKHFDETAVLCLPYDEHPTLEKLPCDGLDWEPKGNKHEEETFL